MSYYAFKLLLTAWGFGYSLATICTNFGIQYASFVITSAPGNVTQVGPRLLLEPLLGFRTSYDYIMAGVSMRERSQRAAGISIILSASARAILTDPPSNVAAGGLAAAQVSYMKAVWYIK